MIDAWLSSSEHTSTPSPPNVVSTPRFAAKPVGKSAARGVAFHSRELALELGVDRARADDEARRARAGAPAVERVVRGRDHGGMRGEAEVVVRRERHDGVAVGHAVRRSRSRGARQRPGGADRARPRSSAHASQVTRAIARSHTSSIESPSACTIWWISGDVIVSGGISTTVSPIGRSSTPRSTAAALTRRPQRSPSARRRELDAAHESFEAHLAHRGLRRDAVVQQVAQLVGALAHVGEHVPRFDQLEVPQRDRGRERVPAVGVAVVQRALAEVVAEERVEHAVRSRPSPTSGGSPRSSPCRGTAGRAGGRTAPTRTACRCGRSRSRPRRRSAARRARGTRRRAARARRGRRAACPAAPCTSGSTITAASSGACSRDHAHATSKHVGIVERGRAQHGKAQRVEDVGAEAVVADRERADRVAVVRAAEREERRAAGDAEVRPVLERDLQRLLDRRRAVGRVEEVRLVDGHDPRQRLRQLDRPTRLPLPSIVECAPSSSCWRIASSSSGTWWPSVLTHSDEIASR